MMPAARGGPPFAVDVKTVRKLRSRAIRSRLLGHGHRACSVLFSGAGREVAVIGGAAPGRVMAARSNGRGLFLIRRSMPSACSAVQSSLSAARPSSASVGGMPIAANSRLTSSMAASACSSSLRPLLAEPERRGRSRPFRPRRPRGCRSSHRASWSRRRGRARCGSARRPDTGWHAPPRCRRCRRRSRPPVAPIITSARASSSLPSVTGRLQAPAEQLDGQQGEMIGERVLADEHVLLRQVGGRGSRRSAVKASMACVSASAPAIAVRPGGQVMRQFGIADGGGGDQIGAGNADLQRPVGIGDHGDRRHLGAGAGGGRHGDHRQDRAGNLELAVIVLQLAAMA